MHTYTRAFAMPLSGTEDEFPTSVTAFLPRKLSNPQMPSSTPTTETKATATSYARAVVATATETVASGAARIDAARSTLKLGSRSGGQYVARCTKPAVGALGTVSGEGTRCVRYWDSRQDSER